MKKFLAVLALIIVTGFGGFFLSKNEAPTNVFGAVTGPDNYNHLNFYLNHTDGGVFATTSAATATTLTAKSLTDISLLNFTPGTTGITATLPSTTTLNSFVPKLGDTQLLYFCNATTTAATPVTLAAGSGMTFTNSTSTLAVATGKCASLMFIRNSSSTLNVLVDIGS